MFPRALNPAPLVEFSDLSAETSLPPVGSVTMTSACSRQQPNHSAPATRPNRNNSLFISSVPGSSPGSKQPKNPGGKPSLDGRQQLTCQPPGGRASRRLETVHGP